MNVLHQKVKAKIKKTGLPLPARRGLEPPHHPVFAMVDKNKTHLLDNPVIICCNTPAPRLFSSPILSQVRLGRAFC